MKSTFYRAQRASAVPRMAVFSLSISAVMAAAHAAGTDARTPPIVALSAPDLYFLNRITWGAKPSSAQEFVPKEAQDRIDELSISHTPMERFVADMDQELKTVNAVSDSKQKQDAQKAYQDSLNRYGREPAVRSILRDLYSPPPTR
jgi:hypothetical protein